MPPEDTDFVTFLQERCILDQETARTIQGEIHDFREAAAQIALRFGLLSYAQLDQVLSANGTDFGQTVLELEILNERQVELLGQVGDLQRAVEVCVGLMLAEKMSLESTTAHLQEYFIQKTKRVPNG